MLTVCSDTRVAIKGEKQSESSSFVTEPFESLSLLYAGVQSTKSLRCLLPACYYLLDLMSEVTSVQIPDVGCGGAKRLDNKPLN